MCVNKMFSISIPIGVCVGHVDFMLFVSFFPAMLLNVNADSGGIWTLKPILHYAGDVA